jgi:iron complex outermembrane receptor protein
MKKKILLFALSLPFLIVHPAIKGQENIRLKLTDKFTGEAIEDVHYFYRNQKGATGKEGILEIPLPVNATLTLSHIHYGTQILSEKELLETIPSGVIVLKPSPMTLNSINVIGVRPEQQSKEITPLRSMEMMSHDAGAILNRIPALNGIRKGGGYGYDPVLRGFKYSQVKILIDGIQTTTVACPNRMDPPTSQVSVNTLSAVEVHKGPYSLRYGNQTGGVINFLSSDHSDPVHPGGYARFSTGIESNGGVLRSEALAGIRNNRSALQVTGSYSKGNDYSDGNGNMVPASFTRANAGMAATFKPIDDHEIRASLTRNFARNADYPALPMDLRSDDTWLLQLSHNGSVGKRKNHRISTSAYASLVDHLMDNLDKEMDPRMLNAETAVKTRNFGARSELTLNQVPTTINAGIDFNFENADGYRTREFLTGPNAGNTATDNVWQNGAIIRTGIFAEYRRTVRDWRFNFSGRMNVNHANAASADASFLSLYEKVESTQFNPGFTGGIERIVKGFSYALWAGRVQRSGDLSERFMNSFPVGLDPYELVGNPTLKPEVNNQADLIIGFSSPGKFRIELDLFYSYLQDFISSTIREDLSPKMPSAPGVRQYDNIQRASITGAEFAYTHHLPLRLESRFDLAATFGKNRVTGDPLPEIPPVDIRWSLSGTYLNSTLAPAVYLRYVLKQDRISSEFGETETPSFWLTDIDLSYTPVKWMKVSAGIRNLFDIAYYEHLNRSVRGTANPINNPGRNIFAAVSFQFD